MIKRLNDGDILAVTEACDPKILAFIHPDRIIRLIRAIEQKQGELVGLRAESWQSRVYAETTELNAKIERIAAFINSPDTKAIISKEMQSLIIRQWAAMCNYGDILVWRLKQDEKEREEREAAGRAQLEQAARDKGTFTE